MNASQTARPEQSARYLSTMEQRRSALTAQFLHIFSRASEFTCEFGCGHGHFLTAYAQANASKLCVGIDIAGDRIERALRKRDRAKLDNLFFVHAEASLFLATLPAGTAINELFILFPDPWPKARHHKHRIVRSEFLSAAASRAVPNSRLCFRTDFAPYFKAAYETVETHAHWTISDEPWPFEFNTVFQSRAPDYQSFVARSSSSPNTRTS
jgi:tRNA (guanine-N7-)-methyltransferase